VDRLWIDLESLFPPLRATRNPEWRSYSVAAGTVYDRVGTSVIWCFDKDMGQRTFERWEDLSNVKRQMLGVQQWI